MEMIARVLPLSIIYVDDEEDDVFIFKIIIKKINPELNFTTFKDGQDLIDFLALEARQSDEIVEQKFVVFMDINMPRMNGWEALETINKHYRQKFKNLAIVMMSSSSRSEDVEQGKLLGANKYLIKSPYFEKMLESLRDTLEEFGCTCPQN